MDLIPFIFCIYMLNLHLNMNKGFKDQVKTFLSNTFGADTNRHINKTPMNRYTRVLALLVFYEHGTFNPRKMFKVLSCVIWTIIERYVCIDYLGTETKKIRELSLGCSLKTRHKIRTLTTYLVLVFQIFSWICCHVRDF